VRPNPFGYSTEAQKHAGRPAVQSLRAAGRAGAPKLWSVGRRSVKLFNTIEGARTGMWCHADAGPLPSAWQCWQCSGLVAALISGV